MADTDLLVVSRDGVNYKITRAELDAYLNPSVYPAFDPSASEFFDLSVDNTRASVTNSTNMFTQKTSLAMPKTGKWYAEFTGINVVAGSGTGYQGVGICDINTYPETAGYYLGNTRDSYGYLNLGYQANNGGLVAGAGETWTNGDVLGVAVNLDDGILTFYKNGVAQGTPWATLESSRDYCFAVSEGYTLDSDMEFNGGQKPFAYTIPTGYKPLTNKD